MLGAQCGKRRVLGTSISAHRAAFGWMSINTRSSTPSQADMILAILLLAKGRMA
jgi:hypothetical protein